MNSDTYRVMRQLKLNDKEIRVYLSLLESGASSAQNIARSTSIPRSTVYQRLENLKDLGFVNFEVGENGKVFRAVKPDKLKEIIDKRVEKSKKLADDFSKILPELESIYHPKETKAKIMHFEGIKGLQRMIYNYEMEAKSKNIYGYTTNRIERILGKEFIKKYHRKFIQKNYRDHFIISDSKENKDYISLLKSDKFRLYNEKRIEVKVLPTKMFDPKVSISIYDDKYSISLMKGGKPFGVLIQNQEIADHQMDIFKMLWEIAEPV